MPQITINEVSRNYTYNIGSNAFAEVAFPITAAWGPGYVDPATLGDGATVNSVLEDVKFLRFPATQQGLEAYVTTFRGPASNYRAIKDYSYFYGMTLLTSGYDVLVCRVTNGNTASGSIAVGSGSLAIKGKYPGSFGNNLRVDLTKIVRGSFSYFNAIVSVIDINGGRNAVENLVFTVADTDSDTIPTIEEVKSNFIQIAIGTAFDDTATVAAGAYTVLSGGSDTASFSEPVDAETVTGSTLQHFPVVEGSVVITATVGGDSVTYTDRNGKLYAGDVEKGTITYSTGAVTYTDTVTASTATYSYQQTPATIKSAAVASAVERYNAASGNTSGTSATYSYTSALSNAALDTFQKASNAAQSEWIYTAGYHVYSLLFDKLNYNPARVISPGWDDQDINQFIATAATRIDTISPLHAQIMSVSYFGRCATGLIDAPKSAPRSSIYNEGEDSLGYAQMLARGTGIGNAIASAAMADPLFSTHYALFAPWGHFRLVGMTKQSEVSPSLLALLIQRAMILNQPIQYEWALPTNRKQNLAIGELAYKIPTKVLDQWTELDGAGVNSIAEIPGLGTSVWGNSTSFEVPPATYQALANLSTRYLYNAVKDIAYKCGIAITYQYNNAKAYDKFYAGVTPLLDTMKNVGAIEDYYVRMAADINGLDQVNANTVIGQIYLIINGVVQNIVIDLIALPPGSDIASFIQ